MVSAAARFCSGGVDALPASQEKNEFGIAQGTATPLLVVREQNFIVTPDSATSLSIESTWVASRLTRNGQQKEVRPNCSAGDRGSEDQVDP